MTAARVRRWASKIKKHIPTTASGTTTTFVVILPSVQDHHIRIDVLVGVHLQCDAIEGTGVWLSHSQKPPTFMQSNCMHHGED
eukprot:COSAG06_NODE_23574_length_687_cov_11.506803_1_plen_82_part_10